MRPRTRFLLAILALAGLAGSVQGIVHLGQAMTGSQDLYRLDTVGSQMESDLEFQIQESRRAFLYALPLTDPNDQLPYIDAAREAAHKVRDISMRFEELNAPPNIRRALKSFETSWNVYTGIRDDILARILSGDLGGAMLLEQRSGNEAFAAALRNLRALKLTLEEHAKSQSSTVDQTLKDCIVGLAFFVAATFLIVGALIKANRIRAAVARSLQSSNQKLEHTQDLDRRRVSILEMVSAHAPLSRSLAAIAELAGRYRPGSGAALWSPEANVLLYQVSAGLPEALTTELRSLSFELAEGRLKSRIASAEELPSAQAAGLESTVIPLQNAAGDWIGLLMIFIARLSPPLSSSMCSQMAQLASLAIENTLLYERLAFQAQHDVLTGLPNRLLFQDRLQQSIRRAQRNQKKAAVLWCDLDRFKQINDTLGHRTGDELLCEVARRLRSVIRESDTAARIGGDEFVVLVSDLDTTKDATVVAEKIMESVRLPIRVSGHDLRISVSMGVSIFPHHGADPAVLMRNADLAMYKAKRAGRNAFQIFLTQFGDSLGRRMEIEQALKHALSDGEFHLEYQPLIDRKDQLAGFEALLRWNSRKLGPISPAEFIPIAEEAGLIGEIGEWVTRTACQDGARWSALGNNVPPIAVNASGNQFMDRGFSDMVRSALEESGFPASKLEIEVTETALVKNLDLALEQIARLRELGIKFSIDDFGTGYSSLNQLRTLPVDYVKVDRSFIKDLHEGSGDSTTLVRGIISLAHNLKLHVVAEGVETEQQLTLLRSFGCDISQGFFLHRPMKADSAEELMKQYTARNGVLPAA